jgi:hypothetical protein
MGMGGFTEQKSPAQPVESLEESAKTMLSRVFSKRNAAGVQRKTNTSSN